MGAGRRPPDRDVLLYYECSYEEAVWRLYQLIKKDEVESLVSVISFRPFFEKMDVNKYEQNSKNVKYIQSMMYPLDSLQSMG